MNKIILYILLTVLVVILLIASVMAGIFYQTQKDASEKETFKILNSKIISSINLFGKVANVNGKDIILEQDGDSIALSIKDDIKIGSSNEDPNQTQIKEGDILTITAELLSNGQLEIKSIFDFGNLN